MVRYVDHQLRSVFSALAAALVSWAGYCAVRGIPEFRTSQAASGFGMLLAFVLLWTLLKASRIKHVSEVRAFEAAVPLPDPDTEPPPTGSLRRHPLYPPLFVGLAVFTLAISLFWEPTCAIVPLWLTLDWLGETALGVIRERRHGRRLWRGHQPDAPYRLSYSPHPSPTDSNRHR